MPAIRLERTAIRTLFLGLLGFDHLQLAYDPMSIGRLLQDDWFVVEGVRDVHGSEAILGVQGVDGQLTLSRANAASGSALAERIGTPSQRGSTIIASGAQAPKLWSEIISHAREIQAQQLPYFAYAAPGSDSPALNSSSVIATLLRRVGMSVEDNLPRGMRRTPGIETFIGTADDDWLSIGAGVTTLIGAAGNDILDASAATAGQVIKLYGGDGNDVCIWSPAVSLCHGGMPGKNVPVDGADTIVLPSSRATVGADIDALNVTAGDVSTRLISVETLRWSDADDHINVMPSALQLGQSFHLDLGGEARPAGNVLDLSNLSTGLVAGAAGLGQLRISQRGRAPITASGVGTLKTTQGDDVIRTRLPLPVIVAGGGDDEIVLEPAHIAQRVDIGSGENTVILNRADFFPSRARAPIILSGGGRDDRLSARLSQIQCAQQSTSARTIDLAREVLPEGYALALSRAAADAEVTLTEIPGQRLIARIILRDFTNGDWGFGTLATPAPVRVVSSASCEDGELESATAGLRAKHIQTSIQYAFRLSGLDDAGRHENTDDVGRARIWDSGSGRIVRRPWPARVPAHAGKFVRTTGRRNAHRRRHIGRRDNTDRHRQRCPSRRGTASLQATLRQGGGQLAARGPGQVGTVRSAPGPPGRAGFLQTAARPLGPPDGTCFLNRARSA